MSIRSPLEVQSRPARSCLCCCWWIWHALPKDAYCCLNWLVYMSHHTCYHRVPVGTCIVLKVILRSCWYLDMLIRWRKNYMNASISVTRSSFLSFSNNLSHTAKSYKHAGIGLLSSWLFLKFVTLGNFNCFLTIDTLFEEAPTNKTFSKSWSG